MGTAAFGLETYLEARPYFQNINEIRNIASGR